jgi:hypothetical protein
MSAAYPSDEAIVTPDTASRNCDVCCVLCICRRKGDPQSRLQRFADTASAAVIGKTRVAGMHGMAMGPLARRNAGARQLRQFSHIAACQFIMW